jgi:hypothetical protein
MAAGNKRTGRKTLGILALFAALWGCTTRENMPANALERQAYPGCVYIDTLAANADMGAFQIHPKLSRDGRESILERAQILEATHIVWLADHPFGAAAMVYRCGR